MSYVQFRLKNFTSHKFYLAASPSPLFFEAKAPSAVNLVKEKGRPETGRTWEFVPRPWRQRNRMADVLEVVVENYAYFWSCTLIAMAELRCREGSE